jgi:NADH-quinone oxidoreductase subunit D
MVSGQRMMTTFLRPGGLWRDVPAEFEEAVYKFIDLMPKRIDEYQDLLDDNELFIDRTRNVALISKEDCVRWSITGPVLRASGMAYDLRKEIPYSGYEQYNFDIPTRQEGDIYARYQVRMDEMRESLKIIRQAMDRLPYGPVRSSNRKFVPPPRSEIGVSMEALIHHFKLWTEGFSAPKGSVYVAVESPRGELGVFMESDGGPKPYRVHYRTPTFANLQIMPILTRGYFVADVVGSIGSIDIVLGDADR